MRDRRLLREEEKRLLDAALQRMNVRRAPVRRPAASRPHHRRAGTLLPAWRDADDPEQARELGHLPDRHPWRNRQGQGEPPHSRSTRKGRLAAILKRRSALGPRRLCSAAPTGAYQPNIQTAWETLRLLAHGVEPKPGRERRSMESGTARTDRSPLARPTARRRVPAARRRRRHPHHSADARTREHPADAAVLNVTDEELRRGLEVSWNNKGRPLRLASGS